jgi:hypothetical protein
MENEKTTTPISQFLLIGTTRTPSVNLVDINDDDQLGAKFVAPAQLISRESV